MENYESILFKDEDFELVVRLDKENKTIWLTQKEISMLFEINISTTSYHIKNYILRFRNKGGLISKNIEMTSESRQVKLYDFDVVCEVGKRCKSPRLQPFIHTVTPYLNEMSLSLLDNEDIIYDNGTIKLSINFSPKEETVWLSQKQIASLFGLNRSVVT